MKMWSVEGEVLAELIGHTALVYAVACSEAGIIASGKLRLSGLPTSTASFCVCTGQLQVGCRGCRGGGYAGWRAAESCRRRGVAGGGCKGGG